MITFLEGVIVLKTQKFAVITVAGVGYKVFMGVDTLAKIPEKVDGVNPERSRRSTVKVWTHDHVREDARELYGFLHYAELEFFELLIGISGIGPKGALGVLAVAPLDTLKRAIASGDTSYLTRVSGIGRKIAEKIILELKDKMSGGAAEVAAPELKAEADALEALISLGYSRTEARDALMGMQNPPESAQEKVKAALKALSG